MKRSRSDIRSDIRSDLSSSNQPLGVDEIVQALQKSCSSGIGSSSGSSGIYYAFFGRNREFTYHFVPNMDDLIENIPKHYGESIVANDLYECKNYEHATGLRCDEYLVFGTNQLLEAFRTEINLRSPQHEDEEGESEGGGEGGEEK